MIAVITRPAHTGRIVCDENEVHDVDLRPVLDTLAFLALPVSALSEQVRVDEESGTVCWPGNVGLDPDAIYAVPDLGPGSARLQIVRERERIQAMVRVAAQARRKRREKPTDRP
jgi:Protein of unknown function (DUF2442)